MSEDKTFVSKAIGANKSQTSLGEVNTSAL